LDYVPSGPAAGGRTRLRGFSLSRAHILSRCLLVFSLSLLGALSSSADTIYQATAEGRQVVVQRQAIVTTDDSSFLDYKHFDLAERRVTRVRLNKGSLPYSVRTSDPAGQQQIVDLWKRFGFQATVTDASGKTTQVFDAYLDFYPPGGRGSLLESVPARTSIPILLEGGGADDVSFSKLARVEIVGDQLKLTLRDGKVESGKFLMPTNQPAEARFLGITDHYDPASPDVFDFSQPLMRLKQIRFE
jgi:hypothetical protein